MVNRVGLPPGLGISSIETASCTALSAKPRRSLSAQLRRGTSSGPTLGTEADRKGGQKVMAYKRWQGPTRPVSNGATVVRLALDSNQDAPGHARDGVVQFRERVDEDVFERAMLLISELVTNSVIHAGGNEVRVDIWRADGSIAVVVADDGPGFPPVAQQTTIAAADSD